MNNLDSRCPNIVNVEIHFNNFMEEISVNYGNNLEDDIDGDIIGYNFKYDHGPKTFHSLLNDIHASYLNDILNHYDGSSLLNDSMNDMVELFQDWVNHDWIVLDIEKREECDKCGYEDVSWCMSNKCQFKEEVEEECYCALDSCVSCQVIMKDAEEKNK